MENRTNKYRYTNIKEYPDIEKLLKLENQNLNSNKDKVYNTLNISIPITEEIIKEVAYTNHR